MSVPRRSLESDQFVKWMRHVRASPLFDAAWYAATYPDVKASGMDPLRHYVTIGDALGRDPGPNFSTRLWRDLHTEARKGRRPALLSYLAACDAQMPIRLPAPNPRNVLFTAAAQAQAGDHDGAVALAERHLPVETAHALSALKANAALARGDEAGWLDHLNAYLAHWGGVPVHLEGAGPPLRRLTGGSLRGRDDGPLVSVLMAAHDAAGTVEAAANSILRQTWRPLELILVDDASTDGTPVALERIASSDSRVRVLRLPCRVGRYVAMNVALQHARGAWITTQDASAWAPPQRIERHLGATRATRKDPVSLTYEILLDVDGRLSAAGEAGAGCPDGVAREGMGTLLMEAVFLRSRIGHWDSVHIGSDAELVGRAEAVLGRKIEAAEQIGMLRFGSSADISGGAGGQAERDAYRAAWTSWHRRLSPVSDAYLPLAQGKRRFDAPAGMRARVPHEAIAAARPAAFRMQAQDDAGDSLIPPRVILHVGMTKAGSTSIQNEMEARREALLAQGILFPISGFSRKHRTDLWRTSGHLELVRTLRKGTAEAFLAECAQHKGHAHTLVLSAENLMLDVKEDDLGRLAALLAGAEVTILALLRSPIGWCLSRYVESVTTGNHVEVRAPENFARDLIASGKLNYAARLDHLARIFGGANVRTLNYDALAASGNLIKAMLCEVGGGVADAVRGRRDNLTQSYPEAIEAQRRLNPIAKGLPGPARQAWGTNLRRALGDAASAEGLRSGPPHLPGSVHGELATVTVRTTRALASRYLTGLGEAEIPFAPPPPFEERPKPNEAATERLGRIAFELLLAQRDAVDGNPSWENQMIDLNAPDALRLYDACAGAHVILCLEAGAAVMVAAAMAGRLVLAIERAEAAAALQANVVARPPAARTIAMPLSSGGAAALWDEPWFRPPDLAVVGGTDANLHLQALNARLSKPMRALILPAPGESGPMLEVALREGRATETTSD